MFGILMILLQTTQAVQESAPSGPWGELTIGGILTIGIIAIWRVNTKLAGQNEKLHNRIASIQEERAKQASEETKSMTEALTASTTAMDKMTTAVENNNRLLERLINAPGNNSN